MDEKPRAWLATAQGSNGKDYFLVTTFEEEKEFWAREFGYEIEPLFTKGQIAKSEG